MPTRARIIGGLATLPFAAGGTRFAWAAAAKQYPLRVPTINGLATLGQIVEVMQRTDVMQRQGLDASFFSFPSAAQIGTAFASGAIDTYIGSDIGVAGLLSRGLEETIISGSVGWRFGFAAAADSPITDLAQLKGKKVGIPFGVSTQVYLQKALERAGLSIGNTVTVVNVPIDQSVASLQSKAVDAVGGWDPTLSRIPNSKIIYSGIAGTGEPLPSTVIAFPTKVVKEDPEIPTRYLVALIESMWYAINHREQTNEWFSKSSTIPAPILDATLKYEPLWKAKSITDINLQLTPAAIKQMDENTQYFVEQKLFPKAVKIEQYVNSSIVQEAMKRVRDAKSSASDLKVIKA